MKKLFLTSGIIACMACPAFADPTYAFDDEHTGTQADSCDYSHLSAYNGTSVLTADWEKNWYFINLDEDDAGGATSGGATASTTAEATEATPDPLYSIYHDNNVYTSHTGTATAAQNYNDWVITNPVAAQSTIVSGTPTGKTVNYTLVSNEPTNTNTANMPTSTGSARTFLGFYDTLSGAIDTSTHTPTGATQYIDATGKLTNAGSTAAYGAQADQDWYARYDCVTPTFSGGDNSHNPTLAGYTFAGWWTGDGESGSWGTQVTPGCIEQDTTLYAKWTAREYTIGYDCGVPSDASSSSHATGTIPASQTVQMDQSFTLAQNTCGMPGYVFAGWDCPNLTGTPTLPAGNPLYYSAGASGTYTYASGDVTCTAMWTPDTVSITWTDPYGSIGGTEAGSCTYDDSISVPNPTRTGYVLSGWTVTSTNPANQVNPANQTAAQPAQSQEPGNNPG